MGRPEVTVMVADEIRFFLAPTRRSGPVPVTCDGTSSLGHVVEALGVPLTEVGGMTVNGEPAVPRYRPKAGDVIGISAIVRPQHLPDARFVLDVHLGTVSRMLRLVGVDCAYGTDLTDDALIDIANREHRVLLTRDRGLLHRRMLWLGAHVRGAGPDQQFHDVLDRFAPPLSPWTRCMACNGVLASVPKQDVAPLLRPGTRRTYDTFSRCPDCGQVYWRGAHSRRLEPIVASAVRTVRQARQAHRAGDRSVGAVG